MNSYTILMEHFRIQMKNYKIQIENYTLKMNIYTIQIKKIQYCNVCHAIIFKHFTACCRKRYIEIFKFATLKIYGNFLLS